jgi:phosphate transport system substrate-binding protein
MISNHVASLYNRTVTNGPWKCILTLVCTLVIPSLAKGERASSLKNVQTVYVGSLGANEGAEELRRELIEVIRHTRRLQLARSAEQSDAVLEGEGGLWIRGYHSLSPRARANPKSAEPQYGGYLSIKVQGKDGETLWSYLGNPKRVSLGDLKHNLASQLVGKLLDDISNGIDMTTPAAVTTGTTATLRGAGATFPFPIYQDWFRSFHTRHPNWQFEYQPTGSEAGLKQLTAGQIDFAGSDIQAEGSVLQFPTVGGAVVLIYNLPRFGDELRLTAEVLANIFEGKIRTWNDAALRSINRHSSLPNAPITVVHRADGSGTTFALTDYLAKTVDSWKQTIGAGSHIKWRIGAQAAGNEGVAKLVADTPYSLGYVEFIYTFEHRLSFASVANSSGRFIQADLPSITAAANTVPTEAHENFNASITNPPGADAYPISTFTWLVVREPMEAAKREAMMSFLEWMFTSGQRQCSALGYAPLPKRLLDQELATVRKMGRPGANP